MYVLLSPAISHNSEFTTMSNLKNREIWNAVSLGKSSWKKIKESIALKLPRANSFALIGCNGEIFVDWSVSGYHVLLEIYEISAKYLKIALKIGNYTINENISCFMLLVFRI